jgi:hypothetical protein
MEALGRIASGLVPGQAHRHGTPWRRRLGGGLPFPTWAANRFLSGQHIDFTFNLFVIREDFPAISHFFPTSLPHIRKKFLIIVIILILLPIFSIKTDFARNFRAHFALASRCQVARLAPARRQGQRHEKVETGQGRQWFGRAAATDPPDAEN